MYRFDEFELNPIRRTLERDGRLISLTPKAFEVLACLVATPGEVVAKEKLLKSVWPESFVEEDNLVQHISALRKAFGDRSKYIVTVPGRGYQFAAAVEQKSLDAVREQPGLGQTGLEQPGLGQPGEVVVQRIRERTRIVMEQPVEEAALAPARSLPGSVSRGTLSQWLAWSVTACVLLAVGGYFGFRWLRPQPQLRKVMISDFLNLAGDSSVNHTLKSGLVIGLSQTPYIQLMSDGLAHATLQQMQKPADTPLLGDIALEVCARGGYQALLKGKIERASPLGYDLTLEAVNCTTRQDLAVFKGHAVTIDATLDTLDDLARRARVKLGEPNRSLDQFNVPLIEATTFSFEALKDYNIGSELGNKGKLKECIEAFQKAVDIDPKFAMAQASLGTAYYNLGSVDTASAYYKKAFQLAGNVSQAEKFYIRSNYYLMATRDLEAAANNFDEWSKVYADDPTAWEGLANAEAQVGDYKRAIAAAEHALTFFEMRTELGYQILVDSYKRANRFADAKRVVAEAQAQGKDAPELHQALYRIAMIERDPETLHREAEWAKNQPELYTALEAQAVLAADGGNYSKAEELFKGAIQDAGREVDANLADNMLMDEVSVELQLGRAAKAVELIRNIQHRDTANFAILQTLAGDVAAGEAYLRKPETYPQDTIEHFLRIPELKALIA
ncbi:MAG: winged helix-turn-helix domain-containing protein, partial [Terracidiphilus sp.]